ncbi:MAG: epoxyqueuosine reductase [Desulfobacterales bacterium]|nr:epoxyqueuosine reductase [Desulfobacterales bacterium]
MDELTQKVVDRLLEWGADLVGVAPVERFENAPEGHRPTDFMPGCKSVISIALHLFQGMADVWGEHDRPDKTITPYLFYGYGLTNIESSRIINRMAKALEYSGYKTLAFMPTWISSMTKYFDETLVTNEITAEFSHRHAAVAAGIAELGWNGLTLTPEFGPMQRLNTLLTSAELEPTPMYNGPALCAPDKCGRKCARICPADAISETETQSCVIGDKTLTYGFHDNIRCAYAVHGMIKGCGGRSDIKIPDGPGQAAFFLEEYLADNLHIYDKVMLENCFGLICGDFCGKCLHKCPSQKLSAEDLKDFDFSARQRAGFERL